MAIPGTPHGALIGSFHVDRIAYALSHIIQFLNLFGCHHKYLLGSEASDQKAGVSRD
jgi:hypothetical protein